MSELINVDLVALTETLLGSDITDTRLLPHDFIVHCGDKSGVKSNLNYLNLKKIQSRKSLNIGHHVHV